jgi:hypothetical protein
MNRNSRDQRKYRQSNKHGRPPVKLRQCYPISEISGAEMLSRTFKISFDRKSQVRSKRAMPPEESLAHVLAKRIRFADKDMRQH